MSLIKSQFNIWDLAECLGMNTHIGWPLCLVDVLQRPIDVGGTAVASLRSHDARNFYIILRVEFDTLNLQCQPIVSTHI
jgi:hypothetical protein